MDVLKPGFTLTDLLIAAATLGLLAAIAFLAYRDCAARADVAEAINASRASKTTVQTTPDTGGLMNSDKSGSDARPTGTLDPYHSLDRGRRRRDRRAVFRRA